MFHRLLVYNLSDHRLALVFLPVILHCSDAAVFLYISVVAISVKKKKERISAKQLFQSFIRPTPSCLHLPKTKDTDMKLHSSFKNRVRSCLCRFSQLVLKNKCICCFVFPPSSQDRVVQVETSHPGGKKAKVFLRPNRPAHTLTPEKHSHHGIKIGISTNRNGINCGYTIS